MKSKILNLTEFHATKYFFFVFFFETFSNNPRKLPNHIPIHEILYLKVNAVFIFVKYTSARLTGAKCCASANTRPLEAAGTCLTPSLHGLQ